MSSPKNLTQQLQQRQQLLVQQSNHNHQQQQQQTQRLQQQKQQKQQDPQLSRLKMKDDNKENDRYSQNAPTIVIRPVVESSIDEPTKNYNNNTNKNKNEVNTTKITTTNCHRRVMSHTSIDDDATSRSSRRSSSSRRRRQNNKDEGSSSSKTKQQSEFLRETIAITNAKIAKLDAKVIATAKSGDDSNSHDNNTNNDNYSNENGTTNRRADPSRALSASSLLLNDKDKYERVMDNSNDDNNGGGDHSSSVISSSRRMTSTYMMTKKALRSEQQQQQQVCDNDNKCSSIPKNDASTTRDLERQQLLQQQRRQRQQQQQKQQQQQQRQKTTNTPTHTPPRNSTTKKLTTTTTTLTNNTHQKTISHSEIHTICDHLERTEAENARLNAELTQHHHRVSHLERSLLIMQRQYDQCRNDLQEARTHLIIQECEKHADNGGGSGHGVGIEMCFSGDAAASTDDQGFEIGSTIMGGGSSSSTGDDHHQQQQTTITNLNCRIRSLMEDLRNEETKVSTLEYALVTKERELHSMEQRMLGVVNWIKGVSRDLIEAAGGSGFDDGSSVVVTGGGCGHGGGGGIIRSVPSGGGGGGGGGIRSVSSKDSVGDMASIGSNGTRNRAAAAAAASSSSRAGYLTSTDALYRNGTPLFGGGDNKTNVVNTLSNLLKCFTPADAGAGGNNNTSNIIIGNNNNNTTANNNTTGGGGGVVVTSPHMTAFDYLKEAQKRLDNHIIHTRSELSRLRNFARDKERQTVETESLLRKYRNDAGVNKEKAIKWEEKLEQARMERDRQCVLLVESQTDNDQLRDIVKRMEDEQADLMDELSQTTKELLVLDDRCTVVSRQYDELKTVSEARQMELNAALSELEATKDSLQRRKTHLREKECMEKALRDTLTQIEEQTRDTLAQMEEQTHSLEQSLLECQNDRNGHLENLTNLKEQHATLQKTHSELTTSRDAYQLKTEQLQQTLSEKQSLLAAAETKLKKCCDDMHSLGLYAINLEKEIEKQQGEHDQRVQRALKRGRKDGESKCPVATAAAVAAVGSSSSNNSKIQDGCSNGDAERQQQQQQQQQPDDFDELCGLIDQQRDTIACLQHELTISKDEKENERTRCATLEERLEKHEMELRRLVRENEEREFRRRQQQPSLDSNPDANELIVILVVTYLLWFKILNLESFVENTKEERQLLRRRLNASLVRLGELEERGKKLEGDCELMRGQLSAKEIFETELKCQLEGVMNETVTLQEEKEEMKETYQKLMEEFIEVKEELEKKEALEVELALTVDTLDSNVTSQRQKLESAVGDIHHLRKKMVVSELRQRKMTILQDTLDTMLQEKSCMVEELSRLKEELTIKETTEMRTKSSLEGLTSNVTLLRETLKSMKEDKHAIRRKMVIMELKQRNMSLLQDELATTTDDKSRLEEELSTLKKELTTQNALKYDLSSQLTEKMNQISQLQQEIQTLTTHANEEKTKLTNQLSTLQTELTKTEDHASTTKSKFQSLQSKITSLQIDLDAMNSEKKYFVRKISTFKEMETKLSQSQKSQTFSSRVSQRLSEECSDLRSEVLQWEAKSVDWKESVEKLQKEVTVERERSEEMRTTCEVMERREVEYLMLLMELSLTRDALQEKITRVTIQTDGDAIRLREELEMVREELGRKKTSESDLQSQLECMTTKLSSLQDHVSSMETETKSLRQKLSHLEMVERQLATHKERIQSTEAENKALIDKINCLQSTLDTTEASLSNLTSELSKMQENRTAMDSEKKYFNKKLSQYKNVESKLASLTSIREREMSQLNQELSAVKKRLEESEAMVVVLNERVGVSDEETRNLRERLAHLEQVESQRDNLERALSTAEETTKNLTKELSLLKETLLEKDAKEVESKTQNDHLVSKLTVLQVNLESMECQNNELREKVERLEQMEHELISLKKLTEDAVLFTADDKKVLMDEISSLKEELVMQEKALVEEKNTRVDSLESQITSLQNEATSYEKENNDLKVKLFTKNDDITQFQSDQKVLMDEISSLKEELMKEKALVDEWKSKVDTLKSQVTSLRNEISSYETEKNALNTKLSTQNDNITKLQSQLSSSHEVLDRHDTQINTLQDLVSSTQNENHQLTEELTSVTNDMIRLKETLRGNESELSRRQEELKLMEKKLTDYEKGLEVFDQFISTQTMSKTMVIENENDNSSKEIISKLKQQIDEQDSQISSLKVERNRLQQEITVSAAMTTKEQCEMTNAHQDDEMGVLQLSLKNMTERLSKCQNELRMCQRRVVHQKQALLSCLLKTEDNNREMTTAAATQMMTMVSPIQDDKQSSFVSIPRPFYPRTLFNTIVMIVAVMNKADETNENDKPTKQTMTRDDDGDKKKVEGFVQQQQQQQGSNTTTLVSAPDHDENQQQQQQQLLVQCWDSLPKSLLNETNIRKLITYYYTMDNNGSIHKISDYFLKDMAENVSNGDEKTALAICHVVKMMASPHTQNDSDDDNNDLLISNESPTALDNNDSKDSDDCPI